MTEIFLPFPDNLEQIWWINGNGTTIVQAEIRIANWDLRPKTRYNNLYDSYFFRWDSATVTNEVLPIERFKGYRTERVLIINPYGAITRGFSLGNPDRLYQIEVTLTTTPIVF